MQSILNDLKEKLPEAIEQLKSRLLDDFPKDISDSIFENLMKTLKRIK